MSISFRAFVLYAHVLALIVGVASILFADARIMRSVGWWLLRRRDEGRAHPLPGLRTTQLRVSVALLILWITGGIIVYLDFKSWDAISSKLMLKLLAVFLLTINGFLLHRWVFPAYERAKNVPALIDSPRFYGIVIFSGFSSYLWLVSVFAGLTGELRQHDELLLMEVFATGLSLVFVGSCLIAGLLRWKLIRKLTPEFKAKVALAALREDKTVDELCMEYQVHANEISQWRRQLLNNAAHVFGKDSVGRVADLQSLHAKIGQLTLQNDFLEEALAKARLPSPRG